jgi:type IX secretion system PorP/SprF family membrane protein
MILKLKHISSCTLFMLLGLVAKGQDAAFTQYYSSMLYLNPAFVGEERDMEISMNLRTQWKTVAIPYQTSQISFITPIYIGPAKQNHLGGLGLSLYTDNAGIGELKTIGGNVSMAKLIQLTSDNKNTLSFGLQAGLITRKINYDNLQWGEQYQPFLGYNNNIAPQELTGDLLAKRTFMDVAAGAVYYYNDINEYDNKELSGYFGFSAYHMNEPNESFSKNNSSPLPRIFKIHGGLDIPLTPFLYLSPSILTMVQGQKTHINGGARFIYNLNNKSNTLLLDKLRLTAGAGTRLKDALIYTVGIGNKVFTLGYSYDMSINGLNKYRTGVGASEISITVRNPIDHIFNRVDTPRI